MHFLLCLPPSPRSQKSEAQIIFLEYKRGPSLPVVWASLNFRKPSELKLSSHLYLPCWSLSHSLLFLSLPQHLPPIQSSRPVFPSEAPCRSSFYLLPPSPAYYVGNSVQFSSVTQSCPTLCDPMNRSMPGLPVHHQLPEFTQTHVHGVSDAIQPSHPLSSPSPPATNPSQHQSLFQ